MKYFLTLLGFLSVIFLTNAADQQISMQPVADKKLQRFIQLEFEEVGKETFLKMAGIKGGGIKFRFEWPGDFNSVRLYVDKNMDGKIDKKDGDGIKNKTDFTLPLVVGGKTIDYAFRFEGFYKPKNKNSGRVHLRSLTVLQGKSGREKISLIDNDNNGRFDEIGKDLVIIGQQKYPMPLRDLVSHSNKLYNIKTEDNGFKLTLSPYQGKTVDVAVNFTGNTSLDWLTLKDNETGQSFPLADGSNVVPPGKYIIESCGIKITGEGKKPRSFPTRMHKSDKVYDFSQQGGEITLGGPLTMDADVTINKKGEIALNAIDLKGAHGDKYIPNCGGLPRAYIIVHAGKEMKVLKNNFGFR